MTNYIEKYNAAIQKLFPVMPGRIQQLPVSPTGYPIPWFVATLPNGERDLRIADPAKRARAVRKSLCWVCGQTVGRFKCFVVGPMCTVSRSTSEPPCHLDCARFSVVACPFLTKPKMRRNDSDLPEGTEDAPGVMIERNPGVTAIWVSRGYKIFTIGIKPDDWLIRMGQPDRVEWWAEGRPATRAEIVAAIDGGYPLLEKMARAGGQDEVDQLAARRAAVITKYLPPLEAMWPDLPAEGGRMSG